jgi:hypothetical protein
MIPPAQAKPAAAHKRKGHAILILNDREVGTVHANGGDTSWGFGEFSPNDAFATYAPIFGTWSVLMHAEDGDDRLSRDAKIELAKLEEVLDSVKARLFFTSDNELVHVAQITIDGNRLEWKEY